MGWKKLLLTVGIFILIPAYFLYTPIPDGYSTVSACMLQLAIATRKTVDGVVGNCWKVSLIFYYTVGWVI